VFHPPERSEEQRCTPPVKREASRCEPFSDAAGEGSVWVMLGLPSPGKLLNARFRPLCVREGAEKDCNYGEQVK